MIAHLLNSVKSIIPLPLTQFILRRFFGINLRKTDQIKSRDCKTIIICRYKNGAKGAFCFSIDYDFPATPRNTTDCKTIFSDAVGKLLNLLELFNVPITWGICGETAMHDRSLFKQIVTSKIEHDIGIHTFSHLNFSDNGYHIDEIREDISRCILSLNMTHRPTSFIFPWNREKHWDLLRDLGFIVYRGKVEGVRTIGPPTYLNALWNIPETYYLNERSIDEVPIICSIIDIAIGFHGVFHLWSHPWNLHKDGDVHYYLQNVVQPIMEHIVNQKAMNKLWICTMQELAYYCETRRSCIIKNVEISKNETKFTVDCQITDDRYKVESNVTVKINMPTPYKSIQVFLDQKEISCGKGWWKDREEPYNVYMNLSFEKKFRHVLIKTSSKL
jgi:hypothetical protein